VAVLLSAIETEHRWPAILRTPAPSVCLQSNFERRVMPKFNVGDRVKRIGTLVPPYMQDGIVLKVIPKDPDWFTEYEVNFDDKMIGHFYETQLRLVDSPPLHQD
jgi:hypothetical protein